MFNKKTISFIAIAILISISAFWYHKKNKTALQQPIEITTPSIRNISQYVNSPGTLKASNQITVGSLIAGRVMKIYADDNDLVKKDQLLMELDNGKGDSVVKKTKALLYEARAQQSYQEKFFARQKKLYQASQLSQNEFDEFTRRLEVSIANTKQAEAELELAQQEYNNLFIKSPDNGVIIAKQVDLGQMITSVLQATELFIIAKDLQKMEVHVDIDEADVGMVKEGQDSTFTVDSFPRLKFSGKVEQIRYLAKIVENVVTYAAVIEVDNPELKLRPGMTADVYIKTKEVKNALCIPNKALRINEAALEKIAAQLKYKFEKMEIDKISKEEDSVWIIKSDTVTQIPIELGANDGRFTQITSGIKKNAQIITDVYETSRESALLQSVFKGRSGIG